jgi:serine/threonine protein kinase
VSSSGDLIGKVVKGRYALTRLLGEGGMGAVYEAEHTEVGRRIAVKVVSAAHTGNAEVLARLKREARATGVIESENIVQVIDAGEDEAVGLFIVMEYLKGENLESLLRREKSLDPPAAAMIATQAARGLMRAHEKGIIHRDLKPANIMLCEREDKSPLVKLVDFGIAKLVKDANETPEEERSGLTRIGGVVGTPQYMAPEQALGFDTVDGRTDIYALGALLYEMLTGFPPIPDLATYELKIMHIVTQPPARVRDRVPEIDARLDQLVNDMMAPKQDARPADMQAVINRLGELFSPAEISPASFAGVGLAPKIQRTGSNPRMELLAPPASPKTEVMARPTNPSLASVAFAPTQSGLAVDRLAADRRSLLQDVHPDGVPTQSSKVLVLGGAITALIVAAVAISQLRSSDEPKPKQGLVQTAPSASAPTVAQPLPTQSIPPVEPLAPSAAPSASALALTPIPTHVAPPAPAPVPVAAPAPAPAPVAKPTPPAVDAGPRAFGAAGLSEEF